MELLSLNTVLYLILACSCTTVLENGLPTSPADYTLGLSIPWHLYLWLWFCLPTTSFFPRLFPSPVQGPSILLSSCVFFFHRCFVHELSLLYLSLHSALTMSLSVLLSIFSLFILSLDSTESYFFFFLLGSPKTGQGSTKSPSGCQGQVDFEVGQVTFHSHSPDGQVLRQAPKCSGKLEFKFLSSPAQDHQ